jgi:hypothetical protein
VAWRSSSTSHFTALLFASVPPPLKHTRHRTAQQIPHHTPGRSSTPARPAPSPRRPSKKERAPRALVADRDSHCSLSAQERTASTETRAKRGRLRLIRHRARAPSTAAFNLSPRTSRPRPCFHTRPRRQPGLIRARISALTARSHRPCLPSPVDFSSSPGARASIRVICARIVQTSSRERKHPGANIHPAQIASAPNSHGHDGGSSPAPLARA